MEQYIIERFFPGAGKLTDKDLQKIANNSCDILCDKGPGSEWYQYLYGKSHVLCI